MQRARPPEPPEREPEPEIKLEASPVRCPFCHDGIDVGGEAWVACAGCLARHHDACWGESGACGSCGHRERLTRDGAAPAAAPPARLRPAGQGELERSMPVLGLRKLEVERVFEGEADLEALRDWLRAEVRRALRAKGVVELERVAGGRKLRWHPGGQGDGCGDGFSVEIVVAHGRTTLRVVVDWANLMGAMLGGIGGGVGGGGAGAIGGVVGGALGAVQLVPLFAIGWLALVMTLALVATRQLIQRQRARVEQLVARLERGLAGPERSRSDPKAAAKGELSAE